MEEKNRDSLRKLGQTSKVSSQNDNPKLEWMYKGPSDLLNREEYLLGRAIDKNFEQLEAAEKAEKEKQVIGVTVPKNHVEHECIPFSIRSYRNVQSTEQVDLQRKIMEDPLMLIKQKELESRRRILENPVKLKELHRILKSEHVRKGEKKKKSKKRKKEKKGHQGRKKNHSSSDSSDEDLDKMLAKQYKKIQNVLGKNNTSKKLDINKLLNVKYEKLYKELDKTAKLKKKRKKSRSSSHSASEESDKYPRKRKVSRDKCERNDTSMRRKRMKSGNESTEGGDHHRNRQLDNSDRSKRKQRSCTKLSSNTESIDRRSEKTKEKNEISEEEKELRRREMMENAIWRDKERSKAVNTYRDEYEREEQLHESSEFDKTFINKELYKAMSSQKTVESRIKSNINNIQRSSKSMDTNFARR